MALKMKPITASDTHELQRLINTFQFSLRRIAGEARVSKEELEAALKGRPLPGGTRFKIRSYLDSVLDMANANPVWVSPGGTAGYLSEASHGKYTAKHPSRGPVPRFMERQVRMEEPREQLPEGFDIIEREVINKSGKPEVRFLLWYHDQDTNRYALDWNKAVRIAKRLLKKGKLPEPRTSRPHMVIKRPRTRRNPLRTGYVPQAPDQMRYSMDSAATAYQNPLLPNPNAFQVYYSEKKALGWPRKKILAQWKRNKAAEAKKQKAARAAAPRKAPVRAPNYGELAELEIYELAALEFGNPDFLHSRGMFWRDRPKGKAIDLDLPHRGASAQEVNTPSFVSGLWAIKKKYAPHGVTINIDAPAKQHRR